MLGCDASGSMDEAGFSRPMPWIGLYIAAASLVCAAAMAADAINGVRYKKCWFPCRYFSLNATSLTIIAVAIKLSVDLNTPMPRRQDQLSKLSSSVLICTVMANSMPSLGNMPNSELMMNMIALAILVITSIVNISIQMSTGVIYTLWREHIFVMFLMLLLLVILSFSALTVPSTKSYLERKYSRKHELAMKEEPSNTCETMIEKIKEDLMKYWMMAHTGSPQFVMGRSVTCTASGAFCLLSAAALGEAMARSYLMPQNFRFCSGESDYKWSICLILIAQTIAIVAGTIAPTLRWFVAIRFKCPRMARKSFKDEFKLERYWTCMLVELKECPFFLQFGGRQCRKIVHDAKNKFIEFCIVIQAGIVLISKLVRLISIVFMTQILMFSNGLQELIRKFKPKNSISNDVSMKDPNSRSNSEIVSKLDLSRYVLHLEGEEELVHLMMRQNCDVTEHYVKMGKKKQPKHLIHLLEQYHSHQFRGVLKFDSDRVPSLYHQEPARCWALPIVTLASIALAIPGIERDSINRLLQSVDEGLVFVELIENNLNTGEDVSNIRKAANVVWLGVDLYHKWLDVDLHKLSRRENSPTAREVIESLSDVAKKLFAEFKEKPGIGCPLESPSAWPVKMLAAHSMYRITQTILLDHRTEWSNRTVFETLLVTISDILGACLTNLERVISMECCRSSIKMRKKCVQRAGILLGKTEKLIKILHRRAVPDISPDQKAFIDEWRASHKTVNPCILTSLREEEEESMSAKAATDPAPGDFYLSIQYS